MVEFLEIYQNVTHVLTFIYPYSLAHRGPSTYTAPLEIKQRGQKAPLLLLTQSELSNYFLVLSLATLAEVLQKCTTLTNHLHQTTLSRVIF